MKQTNTEVFGKFLTMLRKEKGFTQKELADQLFVSDKAVSKWERGIGMPNVALLAPIASVLNVTIEELLQGEKQIKEAHAFKNPLPKRNEHKKQWFYAYISCMLITLVELTILLYLKIDMKDVGIVSGLCLLFGGWFCIFVKDLLPTYFDENKINIFTQGICRIHMPGLSFNNANWYYICNTLRLWTLSIAIFFPVLCFLIIQLLGIHIWMNYKDVLITITMISMIACIYIVGKKYES